MNKKYIKYITLGLLVIIVSMVLCGCNQQLVDTTWKFDSAIVKLADGNVVEGHVQSWLDFDGSDMIQVKINDVVYLTHSSNVVLIAE